MLDECKNGQCTCEQEENFFHVKVIPQKIGADAALVKATRRYPSLIYCELGHELLGGA